MTSTSAQKRSSDARPLQLEDFRRVEMTNFNESTRTSQAAIWYRDALYVGTGRAMLGFMGRYTAKQGDQAGAGPGRFGAMRPDTGGREEDGAQVWRYVPGTNEWTLVYNSPLVEGRDGKVRARDRSVRAIGICQTSSDSEPALYLGVGSLERQVVFVRSTDGINFEECEEQGFGLGDVDVPSARNIAELDGRMYSTPTGKNFGRGMWDDNLTDYPFVFETSDPLHGHWRPVNEAGFGDGNNHSINELVAFEGCLYAATINDRRGFQVWKTRPEGDPPYRWTRILENGAWRPISSVPSAMKVYNGALYICATLQRQGRNGRDRFGPFPAEMIRVYTDDTWDLVSGTPRFTPNGFKRPTSGMLGGLGDYFTHVFWRMAEYDGWLYMGTAGWKWMPTYLRDRNDLTPEQLQWLQEQTNARVDGEFSLWRTRDGDHWEAVTRTGFPGANPLNYGIRELISTPVGLYVFPTCKVGASKGGGLEIWNAHKDHL